MASIPVEALGTPRHRTRERVPQAERRRLARRVRMRRDLTALGFLAPNLLFFVVFLVVPMIRVVILSFERGSLTSDLTFAGLHNWLTIGEDPLSGLALQNTFKFAIITIPFLLVLGLGLAVALANVHRGGGVLRALVYFPTLAPIVIAGLVWLFLVNADFGFFNVVLRSVGGKPQIWLGDPNLAAGVIVGLYVWRGVGFWSLFFLAALVGLPQELYAAAQTDGANDWQRFRHITLPLLKRALLFAIVLMTIANLQLFDAIFVLTDGGPFNSTVSVVWYIYNQLFNYDHVGFGSALSLVLLLIILVLTLIQMRLMRINRTG